MHRRRLIRSTLLALGAIAANLRVARAEEATRVAYHLSEFERAEFVLSCIRHHYEGAPQTQIILVVHGPAIRAVAKEGSAATAQRLAGLMRLGLGVYACRNSMQGQGLAEGDLTPGVRVAEQGGVVKLAQLQREGFAYLRP